PALSQDKPETPEIRVGLIGIADNTPAFIADKLGYFAEEGLTAKFNQFPGGATAQQALIAGRIDFLHTNAVSILLARAQG
ncbi:ABC transporter substrate-binding protein, partial [Klebsiella pneumoniae]|nr:ABC transporter substrate-binding protein [Klebsiella pneumoniae]